MSSLVSGEAFRVLQLKSPVVNKLRRKIPGANFAFRTDIYISGIYGYMYYISLFSICVLYIVTQPSHIKCIYLPTFENDFKTKKQGGILIKFTCSHWEII